MASDFADLQKTWETLGAEDPLWAVVSHPDKRGGAWNIQEFLATGVADIARIRDILARHSDAPTHFPRVLDFGCGVGRLCLAWRPHADHVTGVDISEPMIRQAQRLTEGHPGFEFVVNARPDLEALPDAAFDLCFSHICLQHIPWPIARGYLLEFGRVCKPGGWVVFQLPSANLQPSSAAVLRQRLVDALPFGLGRAYRRWRHGSAAVFDVHYTPRSEVLATLEAAGLRSVHQEPDPSAGAGTEGFVYLARKPARAE